MIRRKIAVLSLAALWVSSIAALCFIVPLPEICGQVNPATVVLREAGYPEGG